MPQDGFGSAVMTRLSIMVVLLASMCAATAIADDVLSELDVALDWWGYGWGVPDEVRADPAYACFGDTRFVILYRTFTDPDTPFDQFKTFDYDYKDATNPILEKQLFALVGEELTTRYGLTRDTENPDILIIMDSYIGKKEQYIPPRTITTTRIATTLQFGEIGNIDTWSTGNVPVTSSYTTAGRTEVSYYRNITLNFLDYNRLSSGETLKAAPLIWRGEVESEGASSDLRVAAAVMVPVLFGHFLQPDPPNACQPVGYKMIWLNTLGITYRYTKRNLDSFIINDVMPGSPAAAAGIQPGDVIRKVNGKSLNWSTKAAHALLWNKECRPVTLTLRRKGERGRTKDVEVTVTPVLERFIITVKE
jgi:hypothetical protein